MDFCIAMMYASVPGHLHALYLLLSTLTTGVSTPLNIKMMKDIYRQNFLYFCFFLLKRFQLKCHMVFVECIAQFWVNVNPLKKMCKRFHQILRSLKKRKCLLLQGIHYLSLFLDKSVQKYWAYKILLVTWRRNL